LHDGSAGFNNAYEDSKARAEHAVARFCARARLRFAILRPSIVIGPYATKSTGGSTTGLYGFLREIGRAARALRALGRPVRFRGDGGTTCNLIPVDWFIDDVHALTEEGLQSEGVYHNTCSRPLTIEQVGEVVARALALPGFAIDPHSTLGSPLEERLARRTAFYGSYLWNSKSFLRQRPSPLELSASDLDDYVRGFLREAAVPVSDTPAHETSAASRPG
jgi:nucleoside-diphosphate-sugar epimerase